MKKSILLIGFTLLSFLGKAQEMPPAPITSGARGAECNGLLYTAKITDCSKSKLSCYKKLYVDASCGGNQYSENIKISMEDYKIKKSIKIENELKNTKNPNFILISKYLRQQRENIQKKSNIKSFVKIKKKIIKIESKLTSSEEKQLEKILEK
ncbi:MAG: hypothetical protein QM564_13590 [Bergeyella sp.]